MTRIEILGKTSIHPPQGSSLEIRGKNQHVLAVLIAADGSWVTTDVLIDQVWRERLPANPATTLQICVSRLRKDLGSNGHRIIESDSGYRLNQDLVEIDTARWAQLVKSARAAASIGTYADAVSLHEQARALWKGRVFGELKGLEHVEAYRRSLDLASTQAEIDYCSALTLAGHPARAHPLLRALAAVDPLNERIAIEGMTALLQCGDRRAAMQMGDDHLHAVQASGGTPSASFNAAHLATIDGSLVGASDEPAAVTVGLDSDEVQASLHPHLEPTVIAKILSLTEAATPAVAVIEAPLNYGLSGFLDAVKAGLAVGARNTDRQTIEVTALHAPALASDPDQLWEAMRHGSPCVVIIDDAHLLNDNAFAAVQEHTEPNHDSSVVFVCGIHPADDTPLLPIDPAARFILGPYSSVELHPIVDRAFESSPRLTRASLVALLLDAFDGHPVWTRHALDEILGGVDLDSIAFGSVQGLMQRLDGPAPPTAVATAVGGLRSPTLETLQVGALLGSELDESAIAHALERGVDDVRTNLAEATDAGLLEVNQAGLRLIFPTSQERRAVLDAVTTDLRPIHQRLAEHFQLHSDPRAAEHLALAGSHANVAEVVAASLEAAAAFVAKGKFFDAALRFRAADNLTTHRHTHLTALLGLAQCEERLGFFDESTAHFNQVVAEADPQQDCSLLVSAALGGWAHGGRIAHRKERRRRLEKALRRVDAAYELSERLQAELAYEWICDRMFPDHKMWTTIRQISDSSDAVAALLARRTELIIAEAAGESSIEHATDMVETALVLDGDGDALAAQCACLVSGIAVALSTGQWAVADDWISELRERGDANHVPRAMWQARAFDVVLSEVREGDLTAAEAQAEAVEELGRTLEIRDAEPTKGLLTLGHTFTYSSLGPLEPFLDLAPEDFRTLPIFHSFQGNARFDAGKYSDVAESLQLAVGGLGDPTDLFAAPLLALTATLAAKQRDSAALAAVAALLPAYRDRHVFIGYGGPYIGPMAWYEARVRRSMGDVELADELDEHALAVARSDQSKALGWLSHQQSRSNRSDQEFAD